MKVFILLLAVACSLANPVDVEEVEDRMHIQGAMDHCSVHGVQLG